MHLLFLRSPPPNFDDDDPTHASPSSSTQSADVDRIVDLSTSHFYHFYYL